MKRLIPVTVLLLVLAACGDATVDLDVTESTAAPLVDDTTSSTAGGSGSGVSPTTAAEPQPEDPDTVETTPPDQSKPSEPLSATESTNVDLAMSSLTTERGLQPAEVTLLTVENVTWRDGSLGCPVEGMSYTQALVEGYRIVLSADGSLYHYHGAAGGEPFFCAEPQDPYDGSPATDR